MTKSRNRMRTELPGTFITLLNQAKTPGGSEAHVVADLAMGDLVFEIDGDGTVHDGGRIYHDTNAARLFVEHGGFPPDDADPDNF